MNVKPTQRIPSLDGLRAISIVFVLMSHTTRTLSSLPFLVKEALRTLGYLGVTVFFVISGFIITALLIREYHESRKIDLRAFFKRRAVRIMPAAGLFIVVVLLLGHPDLKQSLYALTFTTSYTFNKAYHPLQHLWSLSVEEQFYLLWPFAFAAGLRNARTCCWAVVATAPFFRLAFAHHDLFHIFPCVADSLAYGCLLAFYYTDIKSFTMTLSPRLISSRLIVGTLCACTAVLAWVGFQLYPTLWGFVPAMIALLTFIAIERNDFLLNCKPITSIGRLSYSLYLWQQPLMVLAGLFDLLPIRLALCFMAASLSYHFIEQPSIKLFKRLSAAPDSVRVPEANEQLRAK